MKIKHCSTFYHLKGSKSRISVHQGGTRSGKTYSILQFLIELCYINKDSRKLIITIVRKSGTSLKGTVYRDFITILQDNNIYNIDNHNKTDKQYILFGHTIEFISLDDAQKIRGRKRDILYINEANELTYEDFKQLIFRTTWRLILDYNPSFEEHWLLEKVLTRDDCELYVTTYKDNPFLSNDTIKEIELLKPVYNKKGELIRGDINAWSVYGLGKQGVTEGCVYNHFQVINKIEMSDIKAHIYACDAGYNDPFCLLECWFDGKTMYVDEKIYKTHLTDDDIVNLMNKKRISKKDYIVCDSSAPGLIRTMRNAQYNVYAVKKTPGSIKNGIRIVRNNEIKVTKNSNNLLKEYRLYKYKYHIATDKYLDEPEDKNNHALDALRYAFMFLKRLGYLQ